MDPLPIPVQTFVNGLRLNPAQTVTWSLQRTAYFMLTLQFASETQYKNYASNPLNMVKPMEADFLVVGGGTAGLVIAGRLAETGAVDVLLLESGKAPESTTEIPHANKLPYGTALVWESRFKEKNACQGLRGGECHGISAHMLGGSSSLDEMDYMRGSDKVFENWQGKFQNDMWGPDDNLPYFKEDEKNANFHDDRHGLCGTRGVSLGGFAGLLEQFPHTVAEQSLVPAVVDGNDGNDGERIYYSQYFIRDGRRVSTAKAYLIPNQNSEKLRMIHEATVTKILLDGNRATGVEFVWNGVTKRAYAKKEVILAAGSIITPTLLKLSGIGPKDELEKFNIPVKIESPFVGKNMEEHYVVRMWYGLRAHQETRTAIQLANDILDYYKTPRSGRYSGVGSSTAYEYGKVPGDGNAIIGEGHKIFEKDSPDLLDYLNALYYTDEDNEAILAQNRQNVVMLVSITNHEPFSKGEVSLSGRTGVDAINNPYYRYGFYSDPNDRDFIVMQQAMLRQIQRETTDAYNQAQAYPIKTSFCFDQIYGSNEFVSCYLNHYTSGANQATGSCRMGPKNLDTVADSNGLVHGATGLRIADSSLFPQIQWGNQNAVVAMVALKISDSVTTAHGLPIKTAGICP